MQNLESMCAFSLPSGFNEALDETTFDVLGTLVAGGRDSNEATAGCRSHTESLVPVLVADDDDGVDSSMRDGVVSRAFRSVGIAEKINS